MAAVSSGNLTNFICYYTFDIFFIIIILLTHYITYLSVNKLCIDCNPHYYYD